MLTEAQRKAREDRLTASRIACLMNGNAEAIMQLYREMIGEIPEEDLSDVWAVQLGAVTEQLNLDWYEKKNNIILRRGEVRIHPHFEWAACTLDGWDYALRCPVECKHVGGREPLEVIIDRYQPQMQWQMLVTDAAQCALSVIMGANAPIVEYIDRDYDYGAEMIQRGKQFMDCVRERRAPVALPAVPPPANATKIYDMTGNNKWAVYAVDWKCTKEAFDLCKHSEQVLKAMVPADAKKCHGHGVRITRDRAGRLSLREFQGET